MSRNSNNQAGGESLVSFRDVSVRFETNRRAATEALRGVSFDLPSGQITGLVGEDGAGKTTLIRGIAGLVAPAAGTLTVFGEETRRYGGRRHEAKRRHRIGYMPQTFGLYEELTVRENLRLHADLQQVARSERRERFRELLDLTGLREFVDRRADALSGGMKQKLGLACALVKQPELLLLDEPTMGVDPVSRRDLWRIVDQLARENGIGVLLSTAYLDEADRCDRVLLLHRGRILTEGTPQEFREQMSGRVYQIDIEFARSPRTVQAELMARSDILDATIRSGRVRAVVREGSPETEGAGKGGEERLPEAFRANATTVDPSVEDAFMAWMPRSEQQRKAARRTETADEAHPAAEVVVRTEDLVKRFGDFEAVRKVGFEVRSGEVFGILGPNGAGKTTTFRMLCGLVPITEGVAHVAGRDLRSSPAQARARLGYMAQTFSLYTQMSVLENLRFFGRAYGLGRRRLKERIDWALEQFALADQQDQAAGELPGGYKQRLAMAASLLHEPDILFLDEPTSGVDPLARREFWLRIGGFAQAGVTVVVTTHFLEEAEYCDRMLILSRGKELATGSPEEIRALAQTRENPAPTIEDAFIALAEGEPP